MRCPICNLAEVPDDQTECPQCKSDLEAFHLAKKIEKTSKSRLSFGIITSVLLIIVLVGWLLTSGFSKSSVPDQSNTTETEINMNAEIEKSQQLNQLLKEENNNLKKQLAESQAQPEKRKQEYIVQEGESLYTIARKVYGNGYKYVDLAKDNNISNPAKLLTGQKLIIYY